MIQSTGTMAWLEPTWKLLGCLALACHMSMAVKINAKVARKLSINTERKMYSEQNVANEGNSRDSEKEDNRESSRQYGHLSRKVVTEREDVEMFSEEEINEESSWVLHEFDIMKILSFCTGIQSIKKGICL